MTKQQSFYFGNVRGKDFDPYKGILLDAEINQRKRDFDLAVDKAMKAELAVDKIIRLDYVNFKTGSANLTDLSKYELQNVAAMMKKYPNMTIEVAGHTDNTGNPEANQALSQARAQAVYDFLKDLNVVEDRMYPRGYGINNPIDTNDTPEGRANNRRTEFQILTQ